MVVSNGRSPLPCVEDVSDANPAGCVHLPESIPAHTAGMSVPVPSLPFLLSLALSITTPARPYPTITVVILNSAVELSAGSGWPFPVIRPTRQVDLSHTRCPRVIATLRHTLYEITHYNNVRRET